MRESRLHPIRGLLVVVAHTLAGDTVAHRVVVRSQARARILAGVGDILDQGEGLGGHTFVGDTEDRRRCRNPCSTFFPMGNGGSF